jgi:hypothetical protein
MKVLFVNDVAMVGHCSLYLVGQVTRIHLEKRLRVQIQMNKGGKRISEKWRNGLEVCCIPTSLANSSIAFMITKQHLTLCFLMHYLNESSKWEFSFERKPWKFIKNIKTNFISKSWNENFSLFASIFITSITFPSSKSTMNFEH